MDKDFLIIAVTLPEFFDEEAKIINRILSNDLAHFVHIRKPEATAMEIYNLIKNINPLYHHRLKLHDHFELIDKYDLGGIHLNSRNNLVHSNAKSVSKSIHSIEELNGRDNYSYVFLSPVFDSISKKGYKATIDLNNLPGDLHQKKVIALGGVTPDKFELLKDSGFSGAALSGYFFLPHQF